MNDNYSFLKFSESLLLISYCRLCNGSPLRRDRERKRTLDRLVDGQIREK